MDRRRISRNRLEGSKNVKRQSEHHYRTKLEFNDWYRNGINRCKFFGAEVFEDLEYKQVFIRWPGEEDIVRTIDDFYLEWRDEYCSQWKC